MTRFVLDSTVLIDVSRGHSGATRFLDDAVDRGEIWSVTPVRTEVRWAMRSSETAIIERLFASIYWLEVSTDIADRAGDFGRRFGPSHGLGVIDAIVAAAAEFLSGDVATLNVRDFPMFPGLQRPY